MIKQQSNWDLISKINQIIIQPITWAKRLETIADIILTMCNSDLVWLLTLSPLPRVAIGLLKVTPNIASDTRLVSLTDSLPLNPHNIPDNLIKQVIINKQALFGAEHFTEEGYKALDLGGILLNYAQITPQAIVPMITGNDCCGVIVVGYRQSSTIAPQGLEELLQQIAQYLALTLQNINLATVAQRQTKQLNTLNKIAQTITSSLDLDQVLHRTMTGIDEILDVEAGSLLLLDPKTNELYFQLILRGAENIVSDYRLQPNEGIAGWVVQHQQPVLVNNPLSDNRFSRRIDKETGFETKSVLCTPIIVNGELIGALEVLNKKNGYFTLKDLELLESVTASLGIAIQNSQLFQELQTEIKYAEKINRFTSTINARNGFQETVKTIFNELSLFFTFEMLLVGLSDDTEVTIQHTIVDKQGIMAGGLPSIPVNQSVLSAILEADIDCDIFDLTKTNHFTEHHWLHQQGFKSSLAMCLKSEKNIVGLLTLVSERPNNFHPADLKRAKQIASPLSIAIEKTRLMDMVEGWASALEDLNLFSEKLLAKTDPDFILETVLEHMPKMLPADVHGLAIISPDGGKMGLRLPQNASQSLINQISQQIAATLYDSMPTSQRLDLTNIYTIYENDAITEDAEIQSNLAWPILTLRDTLGVLYLGYKQNFTVSADLMRLFSLIVSRISGAVENAYLFTEVEQERARLAAILTSTPDGILVIDKSDHIILDNPAANRILQQVRSQSNKDLTDVLVDPTLLTLFETAKQSGHAADEFTNKENKTFYTTISPVYVGTDTIIGWVAVMQDVTHFKELNEAKNTFVNTVSHDLRSPLSSISIATDLVRISGDVNEKQKDLLKTTHENVGLMKEMIDNLLDVGKIESNIDMEMTPNLMGPIVSEVVNQLRGLAERKGITLQLETEEITRQVMCNINRLKQVFSNLINNAIKYSSQGSEIKVKLYSQNNYVLLEVIDQGIGIPKANQPHIFEKFYRVKGKQMSGKKGTGLGLAIAKSIIDKHNGKIWVESEFEKGSTFAIKLPYVAK